MIQNNVNGVRTFHETYISWSTRNRGRVQRSQMLKKTKNIPFSTNQNALHTGPLMNVPNGLVHPPKNITPTTAETKKRFAYSAK